MANVFQWIPFPEKKPVAADAAPTETPEGEAPAADVPVQTPTQEPVTVHVGDTVRVHYRLFEKEKESGKAKKQVIEKTRERIQVFEGLVIAIRGSAEKGSFTVRRIGLDAVGIERIFPVMTPWIRKIEVKRQGDVRRAKLYYLRSRIGKAAVYVKEKKSTRTRTKSAK